MARVSKNKLVWVYLPLVVVVVGVLVALALYGRSRGENASIIEITPEPLVVPQESGVELEPSPSSSEEPSPEPSASEPEIEKEDVSVRVLNGSGVEGAAGDIVETIEGLGYSSVSAGNADNFDYEDTVVRYKGDYDEFADEIVEALDGYTVVKEELEDDSEYDIVVVVGVEN